MPGNYNKNEFPSGGPAVVQIGFIVDDILEVNDEEYTITVKVREDGDA